MGMPAPAYYTADMVRALPEDGNRYEVVYGELLVTPAPRLWHQEVAIRLLQALREYLDRDGVLAPHKQSRLQRKILRRPIRQHPAQNHLRILIGWPAIGMRVEGQKRGKDDNGVYSHSRPRL